MIYTSRSLAMSRSIGKDTHIEEHWNEQKAVVFTLPVKKKSKQKTKLNRSNSPIATSSSSSEEKEGTNSRALPKCCRFILSDMEHYNVTIKNDVIGIGTEGTNWFFLFYFPLLLDPLSIVHWHLFRANITFHACDECPTTGIRL